MRERKEDDDAPVWGAGPIGDVIGKTERATFHLLAGGKLPAKKVGGRWVGLRGALRKALEAPQQGGSR
jgi:hypothetical protein